MLISIITPVLNGDPQIQKTLKSIQEQTYNDIEHVIIDGGSTDNTITTVREHSLQRAIIVSEKDNGIYDALNKGIAKASGLIIGILNCGDTFADNDVIASVANCFKNQNTMAVYGDLEIVSSTGNDKVLRKWKSCDFQNKTLKTGWMPPHPTFFCKKQVFDTYGEYNESFSISGDYEFLIRCFKSKKFTSAYLNKTLVKMSHGGVSTKVGFNLFQKAKQDYLAITKHKIGGFDTLAMKITRKIPQFFIL